MATLSLTKLFVNLVRTGEAVSAQSGIGKPQQWAIEGDVKTYAGGRQRAVSTVGEAGEEGVTLMDCTLVQRDTLRLWAGETVQVRDHRGQIWFGTYFSLSVVEVRNPFTLYNITFNLKVVTVEDPDEV